MVPPRRLVAVELVIELPETGLALPRSRVVVLPRLDWLSFTFASRVPQFGAYAMVVFVMLFCTLTLLEEIYELGALFVSALHRIARQRYGARLRFTLLRVGYRLLLASYDVLTEYCNDFHNFLDILSAALVVGWFDKWVRMVLRVRELDLRIDYDDDQASFASDGAIYYPVNERAIPLLQLANDLIALGDFFW